MESILLICWLCWLLGFVFFAIELGEYAARRKGKSRLLSWLGIIFWPVTLFYLWVRHYVVSMLFKPSR